MPTWLVHGFRWPRVAIRIHIILENLEDSAPEWIMAPATTAQLTENFRKQYPEQLAQLPSLRFIEQYDPEDEVTKDQPHAYICDQVHEVRLGVDIDDVRGVGVQNSVWTALVELRDKVAPGEKVGWFVVVNGDVERWAPPISDNEDEEYGDEEEGEETETEVSDNGRRNDTEGSPISPVSQRSSVGKWDENEAGPKKKGLKKWLGKMRKTKSTKDLKPDERTNSVTMSPPLPSIPLVERSKTTSSGKATALAGAKAH